MVIAMIMNKNILKLGVSGDPGSFSEEAGLLYAKKLNLQTILHYLLDMNGVLNALQNGMIDLGIFPVVNSKGGLVRMAFEAMGKYNFKLIEELPMHIQQCLLVKKGVVREQIINIISHSQALIQCKTYLQKHYNHATLTEWQDTAKAAKDLSQDLLPPFTAVIAPLQSAKLYGLETLDKNIQDVNPNITTFIIVERGHSDNT